MNSLLLFFALSLTIFTVQSQEIEGTYANKWLANTGEGIEYVLTINEEGTFTFVYTRLYMDSDSNTQIEVQGTWNLDKHLLVLNSENPNDKDNNIASGLNLNKARYVSISPRNPNFNLVKPSLKFYESEVFYAKDMELIKTASTVSVTE